MSVESVSIVLPQGALAGWPTLIDALERAREKTGLSMVFSDLIEQIAGQTTKEPTRLGAVVRSGKDGALVRVTPPDRPGVWVNSRLPDEALAWDGISRPLTVLFEGWSE